MTGKRTRASGPKKVRPCTQVYPFVTNANRLTIRRGSYYPVECARTMGNRSALGQSARVAQISVLGSVGSFTPATRRSTIRAVGWGQSSVVRLWLSRVATAGLFAGACLSGAPSGAFAASAVPSAAVSTNSITLDVRASRNSLATTHDAPKANQPITKYRWLLNLDNTGTPYSSNSNLYCHPSSNLAQGATPPANGVLGVTFVVTAAGYPQGCEWPSVRYAVASPAVSEGTEADWNASKSLPVGGTFGAVTGLANNCPTIADPISRNTRA